MSMKDTEMTSPKSTARVSRRAFLGGTAAVVAMFTLDAAPGSKMAKALAASLPAGAGGGTLNGWIQINADNSVTIAFGGAEMGQGILTGLAQAAAEELGVAWSQVRTQAAPTSQSYIPGGSWGIRANLQKMRIAGAQAREVLIASAAAAWGVDVASCSVNDGVITNSITKATLTFAQLAKDASTRTPSASPTLRDPSQFRLVGQSMQRLDLPSKVDGSAVFGIDVRVPGMVYAAVRNCPTIGGTLARTPATPSGAIAVVPLGTAVAVVASNTWAAFRAAESLSVSWTIPSTAAQLTSSTISAQAQTLMTTGTPGSPAAEKLGDAPGAFASAASKVEVTYSLPYLPHVCMEVLNCTASVTSTSCEVWVPTQAASWVQATAMSITGLPAPAITVHPTLLGGGLGRKIEQDYVAQAISVSKAIGKPVKLTWRREEDLSHDQYRPMGLVRVRLGADAAGNVTSFASRTVAPSPLFQRGWMAPTGNDNVEGAEGLPYAISNRLVEYVRHPAAVPVGFWRSVGNSINCFAVESAIDELASSLRTDPLVLRRRLLSGDPRTLAVLDRAASDIGWTSTPAPGVARGLAISNGFGSIVALAVEVSQPTAGVMKVNRVACAVDCGFSVNPNQVESQLQGGIIQGISSAFWGQTTFSKGVASSRNFSNTRMLLMKETPIISVAQLQSGLDRIGGIGEVGVPPVAPALANAWFRLTGTRMRSLPFFPSANRMDD
jgi:isoquinoline 1-oxidoreductase beta subunit